MKGLCAITLLATIGFAAPSAFADEVKIGFVSSTTGPYGIWGTEYQKGINLFLAEHGDKVGDDTVTVLYRDVGGQNPAKARQLAQDLIIRDGVAVLAGGELTANVVAVTDLINQAKVPFIVFNTGTGNVTDQSPYFVRIGFTQWADYYPLGQWAAEEGLKKCVAVAADFAPGHDAVDGVTKSFTEGGGAITDSIFIPLDATDFSPYLQRIRDAKPDCALSFIPYGPMSISFVKAYVDSGLLKDGVKLLNQQEDIETDLPSIGVGAVGIESAMPYGPYLDNADNQAFVAAFQAKYGTMPSVINLLGYDGMQVAFKMIEATGGKPDGDTAMAAVKGFSWNSPRGPVTIEPETRELTQNIYIRRVVEENGVLFNKVIHTYENQQEPWHLFN